MSHNRKLKVKVSELLQLLNSSITLFQFFLFSIFDVLAFDLIPLVSGHMIAARAPKYHTSLSVQIREEMGQLSQDVPF